MSDRNPTTSKRWRLKFSVRTLVALLTLVCCYAAGWGPTKTRGVEDVSEFVFNNPDAFPDKPLILATETNAWLPLVVGSEKKWSSWPVPAPQGVRSYYFWFFGYVVKLPYEQEI